MTLSAQLLLVLSTSAPVFQPPAQPLGVTLDPSPASAVPARDEFDDFKKSFNQARAISAKEEMVRLVKRKTTHAVWWIMEIAEGIATRPTDRLVELMADLIADEDAPERPGQIDHLYAPTLRGADAVHLMHLAAAVTRMTGDVLSPR